MHWETMMTAESLVPQEGVASPENFLNRPVTCYAFHMGGYHLVVVLADEAACFFRARQNPPSRMIPNPKMRGKRGDDNSLPDFQFVREQDPESWLLRQIPLYGDLSETPCS